MAYSANTDNFPRITSYASAKAHYDKVKPYRGHRDDADRPIGTRGHKNKQMRLLNDGSVAFQFYSTDCVIYHPDDTLTIEGYSSVSTTAFVNALTPHTVYHAQGNYRTGPVLNLYASKGRDYWVQRCGGDTERNPDYNRDTMVVQCNRPVTLHYCADRWQPVSVESLEPFTINRIDRKTALAASREHHLADFLAWLRMIEVCAGELILPDAVDRPGNMDDVCEQLRDGNFINAATLIPRGEKDASRYYYLPFGRSPVADTAIRPGFLTQLRTHIYEEAGAIVEDKFKVVSPSGCQRAKAGN